ncbi:MAG: acetyl-CoA carboxylase carboxyltransferase subunit alpha [Alphaproteobacteria bacterium]|jgi:acetyl-CoA carboxylase carboxyl transferase subunit alpha
MLTPLEFEKPILELEARIADLRQLAENDGLDIAEETRRLEQRIDKSLIQIYTKLTPWQRVQVARHPNRPRALDVLTRLIEDFTPLAGDRLFGEDEAIIGGIGRFRGRGVVVIGQEKGGDTASRVKRNFGMAHPEGYRKAMRLMDIAEKFSLPVVSFVDTPGAYPGIEAEERGQAEAIARCLQRGLELETPFVAAVLGEGGSGGAVAIAAADKVLMFEHAVYSVISPEGCASILWRSAEHAPDAAEALKLTAADLSRLGVVDTVVKEPIGGAHRNPEVSIDALGNAIEVALRQIETDGVDGPTLRKRRRERFLAMGG